MYVKRNSSNNDLKVVQVFDIIDKMAVYDESVLIRKSTSIKRQQLPNIKAHLYKQILSSLRLLETSNNIDILLHEQLDHARILYNKGLYHQSLKILEKIKEIARSTSQINFQIEVLMTEKKIESLHITRSMQDRADELTRDINVANSHLVKQSKLSNLALQLYSWYIKNGLARNLNDEKEVEDYFKAHLLPEIKNPEGFYEKLYFHQSYCWYAFIRQDYLIYYRHTQKWVDLFTDRPRMIQIETGNYIKGLHNLLSANFALRNYSGFEKGLKLLEENSAFFNSNQDSLSIKIIDFYANYNTEIDVALEEVTTDYTDNRYYFKKMPWFEDYDKRQFNEELIKYALTSVDYRNRIISFYNLYYKNRKFFLNNGGCLLPIGQFSFHKLNLDHLPKANRQWLQQERIFRLRQLWMTWIGRQIKGLPPKWLVAII